jgi:hypothetical protein
MHGEDTVIPITCNNKVNIQIEGVEGGVTALADVGADASAVSSTFLERCVKGKKVLFESNKTFTSADNKLMKNHSVCAFNVKINDSLLPYDFFVFPDLSHDVILGVDFWTTYGGVFDLVSQTITLERSEYNEKNDPQIVGVNCLNHSLTVVDTQSLAPLSYTRVKVKLPTDRKLSSGVARIQPRNEMLKKKALLFLIVLSILSRVVRFCG